MCYRIYLYMQNPYLGRYIYTIKLTEVIPRDGNPTTEGLWRGYILFYLLFYFFNDVNGLNLKHTHVLNACHLTDGMIREGLEPSRDEDLLGKQITRGGLCRLWLGSWFWTSPSLPVRNNENIFATCSCLHRLSTLPCLPSMMYRNQLKQRRKT